MDGLLPYSIFRAYDAYSVPSCMMTRGALARQDLACLVPLLVYFEFILSSQCEGVVKLFRRARPRSESSLLR